MTDAKPIHSRDPSLPLPWLPAAEARGIGSEESVNRPSFQYRPDGRRPDDHIREEHQGERTAVVPDASLRRSIIVINDPQCPLQISSFGLRTQVPDRVLEEAVDARWVYLLDWSLMPKEAITFWEVHSVFYDAVNRFVWVETNNNGPRTGDSKELKSGVMHTTGRMSWWKTGETEKLGRWLTSVHSISPAPVCWT